MRNLIFMGAPGAGKGTQAEILCNDFDMVQISTGEILRDALDKKTKLGLEARGYMNKGNLVPDTLVIGIIKDRLVKEDCLNGFILDGYPRTKEQAQALDEISDEINKSIDHVLFFDVPKVELIKRLLKRAKQQGRTDDNLKSIHNRLRIFEEKTRPVLDYYRSRSLLKKIEAVGDIPKVSQKVRRVIQS